MTRISSLPLIFSFAVLSFLCVATFAYAVEASAGDTNQTQPTTPPALPLQLKTGAGGILNDMKVCPAIYAPVCASNGKTYGNSCIAKNEGFAVVKMGPCGNDGNFNPATLSRPAGGNTVASNTPPIPAKATEKMKQRAEDRAKESLKRFIRLSLASIERLQKIIVRIESRADKLGAKGVETSAVRVDLNTAKTELDAARTDLETLKNSSTSILGARSMAAVIGAVAPLRSTIESVQRHIRAAEKAIREALKKLGDAAKAAGVSDDPQSTSGQSI